MSNAKELAQYIGKRGQIRTSDGLLVEVEVLDARLTYGRIQIQVTPCMGVGNAWKNLESVRL